MIPIEHIRPHRHVSPQALLGILTGLGILSLVSYLFLDQGLFTRQRPLLVYHVDRYLFFKAIVMLGKAWLLIWLILCWAFLSRCAARTSIALAALLLLCAFVFPIKSMVQRPRPYHIIKAENSPQSKPITGNWSFPSGDTASAFAVAAAVWPYIRRSSRTILFTLASIVGLFRIISFSHYLSDVFAGAAVGFLAGWLAYRLLIHRTELTGRFDRLLSPRILMAAVIALPVSIAVSEGTQTFWLFLCIYPPSVLVLYLTSNSDKATPIGQTIRNRMNSLADVFAGIKLPDKTS